MSKYLDPGKFHTRTNKAGKKITVANSLDDVIECLKHWREELGGHTPVYVYDEEYDDTKEHTIIGTDLAMLLPCDIGPLKDGAVQGLPTPDGEDMILIIGKA